MKTAETATNSRALPTKILIRRPPHFRNVQSGMALLILLTVLALWGLSLFIGQLNATTSQTTRNQITQEALAQAKQALISWSVLQGDIGTAPNHRPGSLPCPDTNFIGSANSGNAAGTCSVAGGTSIGRLPWRTLGIEMLRDADGEPLWYAVSDNFRMPNLNYAAINSDSAGTFQLYAADGVSLITFPGRELAAIVFSPGAPLPGQSRNALPDAPESFLDSGNGRNNATASGPFIAGPAIDAQGNQIVNDLSLGISARDLIATVEKRALAEAQTGLASYASAHSGKYPNPAKNNGANCTDTIANVSTFNSSTQACKSDNSVCFGRVPEDAIAPYVADWFLQNGWGRVFTYTVNKLDAEDSSGAGCSPTLNVSEANKHYVLISPGTVIPPRVRPSSSLADYLEDASNSDAWNPDVNFTTPSRTSNDQLRSSP